MEDQFGGRTDDDLFTDDFEPVEDAPSAPKPVTSTAPATTSAKAAIITPAQPAGAAPTSTPTGPAKGPTKTNGARRNASGKAKSGGGGASQATNGKTAPGAAADAQADAPKAQPPPSLAQSRHNRPANAPRPGGQQGKPGGGGGKERKQNGNDKEKKDVASKPPLPSSTPNAQNAQGVQNAHSAQSVPNAPTAPKAASTSAPTAPAAPAAPIVPTAPKALTKPEGGNSNSNGTGTGTGTGTGVGVNNNMRLQSGANPRTKLTDAELNAKMEAMRIASAEKARRFEQAQRDERDHDIAMARGLEEARRRKAADEEKRHRLDEERARNRDRKLKAMGMKESSWDEGKETAREGEARRGGGNFRGAHGGIQNSRHAGGVLPVDGAARADVEKAAAATSAAAAPNAPREFQPGEFRGRGGRSGRNRGRGGRASGGRGGGGGGRGGRMTFDDVFGNGADVAEWVQGQPDPSTMTHPSAVVGGGLSLEAFPALPGSSGGKKTNVAKEPNKTAAAVVSGIVPPLSPPIGTWDEEVAAMDAELAAAAAVPKS